LKEISAEDGRARLVPLLGKKIRLTGTVKLQGQRPEIEIPGIEAIEVVP
jgi:hypothetical protein